jgi:7-cyano-7-deazaguanine reductase
MSNSIQNPLGQAMDFPQRYSPESLFAIPRSDGRRALGLTNTLPFRGQDLWNAWEFAWLDSSGRPVLALAELRFAADSPKIVESKSMKLYLNSFASSRYASAAEVRDTITSDLEICTTSYVAVTLRSLADIAEFAVGTLPGPCIDDAKAGFEATGADADVLRSDEQCIVTEELHSNVLRSNCPVTGQPDTGSLLIRYHGPKIDRSALLDYIVSFRNVREFHETCVERIFLDLKSHCAPQQLTVYARYNRRGGIDINPFRSDFEDDAENLRLARQ